MRPGFSGLLGGVPGGSGGRGGGSDQYRGLGYQTPRRRLPNANRERSGMVIFPIAGAIAAPDTATVVHVSTRSHHRSSPAMSHVLIVPASPVARAIASLPISERLKTHDVTGRPGGVTRSSARLAAAQISSSGVESSSFGSRTSCGDAAFGT